jgi:hypothetical protein
MFKVGDKVRFNKLYNGIIVEIAQWDEQNRRWKLSTGEHSVFGPYIIHIPENNLIIGAIESEIQPLQGGAASSTPD